MSKMSRNKGAAAEREVFKIIRDVTGIEVKRNLDQYQESDSDCHVLGFCIEIKRVEELRLKSWWAQVVEVAKKHNEVPVLIYRQSRQQWRAVLPWVSTSYLCHVDEPSLPESFMDYEYTQTVFLDPVFTMLLSESETGQRAIAEAEALLNTQH